MASSAARPDSGSSIRSVAFAVGSEAIGEVSPGFASHCLDTTTLIRKEWCFNLESETFVKLCRHLAPGYLRFGGNPSNRLVFRERTDVEERRMKRRCSRDETTPRKPKTATEKKRPNDEDEVVMTRADWDRVNALARKVGWKLLFTLNPHIRTRDGEWDHGNAEELLKYSQQMGYQVDWSLGNEPKKSDGIDGDVLGRAMLKLRELSDRYTPGSRLSAPDLSTPRRWKLDLTANLTRVAGGVLDAVSFHHYYLDGRRAMCEDFFDPEVLDNYGDRLYQIRNAVARYRPAECAFWNSESGSAFGGGAPNLSDTYAASFAWLDKLGLAASVGVQYVMRQSVIRGHYRLFDGEDFRPMPDYWVTLVYKRLVGTRVYKVTLTPDEPLLRVYAHNARSYPEKGTTVFVLNLSTETAVLTPDPDGPLCQSPYDRYLLTPGDKDLGLLSKAVRVNGRPCEVTPDGEVVGVGEEVGEVVEAGRPLEVPPRRFAFFVFHR